MNLIRHWFLLFFGLISVAVFAQGGDAFINASPIVAGNSASGAVCLNESDFYKSLMPSSGTIIITVNGTNTSNSTGFLHVNVYDTRQNAGKIAESDIGSNSIAGGGNTNGVISIPSRLKDSFYIEVISSVCFDYTINYTMTNVPQEDMEPNNNFAQSIKVVTKQAMSGNVGYLKNGEKDMSDYYGVKVPGRGRITFTITAINTSSSVGFLQGAIYQKQENDHFEEKSSKYIDNYNLIEVGATISDFIFVQCLDNDSAFLKLNTNVSFSYTVTATFSDENPKAKFDFVRVGNTFAMENLSEDAFRYNWNMGNGTYYNDVHTPPITSYTPGYHEVTLTAYNYPAPQDQEAPQLNGVQIPNCENSHEFVKGFTVVGFDRFTPSKGGQGNVEFSFWGGGFDENVQVRLKRNGLVINDSAFRISKYGNIINTIFDLHNQPLGMYDVEIEASDTTYYFENGFELEPLRYKTGVAIIADGIIRSNTARELTVRISNLGNVGTGITKVYLLIPDGIKATYLGELVLDKSLVPNIDADTISNELRVTVEDGYPINGTLQGFFINSLPVNGTRDLVFTINASSSQFSNFHVWLSGPISGSPLFGWVSDCWKARMKLSYALFSAVLDMVPGVDCAWNVVKLLLNAGSNVISPPEGALASTNASASLVKAEVSALANCSGEAAALGGPVTYGAVEIASISYDIANNSKAVFDAQTATLAACDEEPKEKPEDKKEVESRESYDPNAKYGPSGYGSAKYINGYNPLQTYLINFENLAAAGLPAQKVVVLDTLDKDVYDLSSFVLGNWGVSGQRFYIPPGNNSYLDEQPLSNQIAVRAMFSLDTTTGILRATFLGINRYTNDVFSNPLNGFLPPNQTSPEGEGFFTYSIKIKTGLAHNTLVSNKASIYFDNNAVIDTDTWTNTIDTLRPSSQIISAIAISDTSLVIKAGGQDEGSKIKSYELYIAKNGGEFKYYTKIGDSATFYGDKEATYSFYIKAIDSVGNLEIKAPTAEATIVLGSPLPVTFTQFTGVGKEVGNLLSWTTATEQNNKGFYLERSATADKYIPIEFVPSAAVDGSSQTVLNYSFLDKNAPSKAFYRLKQMDKNGNFTYSKVVLIERSATYTLVVAPNPTKGSFKLSGLNNQQVQGLQLIDMQGRLIQTFTPKADGMYNISQVAAGMYLLKVQMPNETFTHKLTVL